MSFQIPTGDDFFAWRREEFPFFASKVFLTHASVSPLPARSGRAISEYALRIAREGQFDHINFPVYQRCKERIAALLGSGAKAEEVAFAGSTSHALGLVATSYAWKPGDNCIVYDGDFPANVVVWKNLAHTHGVEVRLIPNKRHADLTVEDLAPLVDERTRMVSLSAVNFLTGHPLDVKAFGQFLHARGVLFCVDGIQALGAVQIDTSEVDFVCADAHKWMLGPNGAAFAWFRSSVMESMRPQVLGWLATKDRMNLFGYDMELFPTAERFEPGARNYVGIVGMEASLAVIQDAGIESVEARITALRDYTARKLQELDCTLLWTPEADKKSGIVSFQPPRGDVEILYKTLDENFAVSIRPGYEGDNWIRISPHFMNCEQDIDELAQAIHAQL